MSNLPNRRLMAPLLLPDGMRDSSTSDAIGSDPYQLHLPLKGCMRSSRRQRAGSRDSRAWRLRRYTMRFALPDGQLSRLVVVKSPRTGYILSYELMPEPQV